jgi:ATP/ADP translocase
MNKYQRITVFTSIAVLVFFLVLSLITRHWGFFLWSLLPVFMILITSFSTKRDKKCNGR